MRAHPASVGSCLSAQEAGSRGSSVAGCPRCRSCPCRRRGVVSPHNSPTMANNKPRTFIGRLWRSVLLGVADGIPGVSQVVTVVEHLQKPNAAPILPRLVVGWTTVAMMGMLIAARLWGGFGWDELVRLLGLLAAF